MLSDALQVSSAAQRHWKTQKVLVLLSARTWDLKCCILAVSSFGKHECEAICKADFLRQKIPMLDDVEYIDALIQYIM